jgi:hypothetical protein
LRFWTPNCTTRVLHNGAINGRPTSRAGSSKRQFKRRVPGDVLDAARGKEIAFRLPKTHSGGGHILARAKVGPHVTFSLRTSDPSLVKLRHVAAMGQFEEAMAAFRAGPQRLSQKDRVALAGELYRDLTALFEDDPVCGKWWQTVQEVVQGAILMRELMIAPGHLKKPST